MKANPGAINSGSQILDQIVTILMSTSMFTAGVLGFFLDNTIPGKITRQLNFYKSSLDEKISLKGTDEERGLTKWLAHPDPNAKSSNEESAHERELPQCTYDIPLITPWLKR
jgi:hypothetical protein